MAESYLVYARENAINEPVSDGYWVESTDKLDALRDCETLFGLAGDYWVLPISDQPKKFNVRTETPTVTILTRDNSDPNAPWPEDPDGEPKEWKGIQWTAKKKPSLWFVYARGEVFGEAVSEGYLLWEFTDEKAIRRAVGLFDLLGDYSIAEALALPAKGHIPEPESYRVTELNKWSDE